MAPHTTDPATLVATVDEIAAGLEKVQAELDAALARPRGVERELRLADARLAALRERCRHMKSGGEKVGQAEVLGTLGDLLQVEAQIKALAAGEKAPPSSGWVGRRRAGRGKA